MKVVTVSTASRAAEEYATSAAAAQQRMALQRATSTRRLSVRLKHRKNKLKQKKVQSVAKDGPIKRKKKKKKKKEEEEMMMALTKTQQQQGKILQLNDK